MAPRKPKSEKEVELPPEIPAEIVEATATRAERAGVSEDELLAGVTGAQRYADPQDDDQDSELAPNAVPVDPMTRLAMAIEAMVQMQARAAASGGDISVAERIIDRLTPALERMAQSQIDGAKIQAQETRRAFRPSNEVVPMCSVINPRGNLLDDYKKPLLRCVTLLPWLMEDDSSTREEVELVNLLQPGTYVVKRIDNTKIRLTVNIEYNVDGVRASRLIVNHETAFNNDYFKLMPPLADWLRQVLGQHDDTATRKAANEVLTMEEEEVLIQAGQLSVSQ